MQEVEKKTEEEEWGVDIERARRLLGWWWIREVYHRAEVEGWERLPREGGALLVSNHGRLDFDSVILMRLLLRGCGRLVRGMAERVLFRVPLLGRMVLALGAVEGTRENAERLLGRGEWVLTYPGGLREIMGSRFGVEEVRWEGRLGFARVAIASQVPVVPIASLGGNRGFLFLTEGRWLGKILYGWILGMKESEGYRDPLVLGILPIPLPYSWGVHFPLPCKVRYVIGESIYPDVSAESADDEEAVRRFAQRVESAMRAMLTKQT